MTKLAELSEPELVAKFKNNELSEHEFFSTLIEHYYPALMRFGRVHYPQALNETEIEDLVQSTFLDVFKLIRKNDFKSSLRTWFFNILRGKVVDELRKRKGGKLRLNELESSERQLNNKAIESMTEDSIYDSLREILKDFSTEENKLIMLYFVEGMSVSKIAEALNESPVQIRHNLNRIKVRFRRYKRTPAERNSESL